MNRVVSVIVGLSTLLCSSLSFAQQSPAKIVYLRTTDGWELRTKGDFQRGQLTRELARQAFLIAAREELGLITRDALMGDEMRAADEKTGGVNDLFEIAGSPGEKNQLEVLRGVGAQQASLWHKDFPVGEAIFDYRGFCTEMEKLSRGEFVEVLKKAGFRAAPVAARAGKKPTTVLLPSIGSLLDEMTFTSQFAAMRQLHEALAEDRESPILLGAIVRGYANLGVLTELHFNPMHKVFKARAMLYAQRMAVKSTENSWALYHRAYAEALIGLHRVALDDLDRADRAAAASSGKTAPPEWAAWLRHFCRFEQSALAANKTDGKQLPALLRYLQVEQAGSYSLRPRVGLEVLTLLPECYRVSAGVSSFEGQSLGLKTAKIGPQVFGKKIYGRVTKIDDLPSEIRKSLKAMPVAAPADGEEADEDDTAEYERRAALVTALHTAGLAEPLGKQAENDDFRPDTSELSWTILSEMIQETSFSQTWRRLWFERLERDTDLDDTLTATLALVERHLLRGFIESFAEDKKVSHAAFARLRSALRWRAIDARYRPIIDYLNQVDHNFRNQMMDYAFHAIDDTGVDLQCAGGVFEQPRALPLVHRLYEVSPFSPAAKLALLRLDQKWAEAHFDELKKDSVEYPELALEIGKRLMGLKRFEEAEAQFRISIVNEPGLYPYKLLANCYLQQGQPDKWLSTLDEFLKLPKIDLQHEQLQVEIAERFMALHQWKKALPYSEAAAESEIGWAMFNAAAAYEALQDWDKAEAMYHRQSEKYFGGGTEATWFFFCKRTGHGDLEAAKKVAFDATQNRDNQPWTHDEYAVYLLLTDKSDIALKICEEDLSRTSSPLLGLRTAIVADERGEPLRRDKALDFMTNAFGNFKPNPIDARRSELIELAKLLIDDLKKGGKAEFDLAAADQLVAGASSHDQMVFYYYMGAYLNLHGKNLKAIEYWKRCMSTSSSILNHHRTLAGAALLKYDVPPKDYAAELQKPIDSGQAK